MKAKSLLATLLILPAFILGSCSLNRSTVMHDKKDASKTFATAERLPSSATPIIDTKSIEATTPAQVAPQHSSNAVAASTTTTTTTSSNATVASTRHHKVASPEVVTEAKASTVADTKVVKNHKNFASKLLVSRGVAKGGGKQWIVALLLVIFLGGLGIHRFYLGYTWQGVVQLLTGGGCGVWALIDLIRIIIRDLKPKDGDYVD